MDIKGNIGILRGMHGNRRILDMFCSFSVSSEYSLPAL